MLNYKHPPPGYLGLRVNKYQLWVQTPILSLLLSSESTFREYLSEGCAHTLNLGCKRGRTIIAKLARNITLKFRFTSYFGTFYISCFSQRFLCEGRLTFRELFSLCPTIAEHSRLSWQVMSGSVISKPSRARE